MTEAPEDEMQELLRAFQTSRAQQAKSGKAQRSTTRKTTHSPRGQESCLWRWWQGRPLTTRDCCRGRKRLNTPSTTEGNDEGTEFLCVLFG